jgi:phosphatidylinositol alpha-1,6-mannosyltransferase
VTIPGRIPVVASSLRYVLRRARVAICAGSFPEEEARRNAAEDLCPVVQVPPGVDTQRFAPIDPDRRREVRETMGFRDDEFLVASYSRLVPRKGMDTLIAASAKLRERYPQLRVVIGGSGRDRKRLERLAAKLHAPVTFLGRVDDDLLPQWLAASDLMVMDCRSRWFGLEQEGFGIVFVEAAACGTAQIAGRSGGSDDAVRDGETGLVLDNPRSVADLAAAMSSLIDDDERRTRFGLMARDVAVREFSWDRLSRLLANDLQEFDGVETAQSLP